MSAHVYLNGSFVEVEQAQVSVYDGGWLHGAGLFETMRAERGRVFRFDAHLERMMRSAGEVLRPIDRGELPDAAVVGELLERNVMRTARLRLTVSAGPMRSDVGTEPRPSGSGGGGAEELPLTSCLTASPLASYAIELYERGVQVAVCDYRVSPSDPTARHKTTAYLPRLLGLRQARQKRCMEALWFTTENLLAEGCISNVFVVKKGVVATPPLDAPVLAGITRATVLEVAAAVGVSVQETPLTINDLLDADEVFLTNAIMHVLPVVRVERHDIAGGKVGPVARRLLQEYRLRVEAECGRA